jgi:hypothetical protein
MVTFVVKKKSVFFSQAAFQLFKFIQILFIYLPFSLLKEESSGPANRFLPALSWLPLNTHGWNALCGGAGRSPICSPGSSPSVLGNDCVLH